MTCCNAAISSTADGDPCSPPRNWSAEPAPACRGVRPGVRPGHSGLSWPPDAEAGFVRCHGAPWRPTWQLHGGARASSSHRGEVWTTIFPIGARIRQYASGSPRRLSLAGRSSGSPGPNVSESTPWGEASPRAICLAGRVPAARLPGAHDGGGAAPAVCSPAVHGGHALIFKSLSSCAD